MGSWPDAESDNISSPDMDSLKAADREDSGKEEEEEDGTSRDWSFVGENWGSIW